MIGAADLTSLTVNNVPGHTTATAPAGIILPLYKHWGTRPEHVFIHYGKVWHATCRPSGLLLNSDRVGSPSSHCCCGAAARA